MTRRPCFIFLILLAPLLFAAACRRSSAPSPTAPPQSSTELVQAQGGTTSIAETKHFKGSIGNTSGLQMKLVREGDTLTGSYFYQKVGTKIDVRGSIDKDGNVVLEEFDPAGNQTGVFQGRWTTGPNGLIQLAGNWNKPNSDKKTPFSLDQQPIEFSGDVEIVGKRIRENNKKLNYEIDAEYPQLVGSTNPNYEKFNQAARALVTKEVSGFRKEMAPEKTDEAEAEPTRTPGETMGSDLGIGYTVSLAQDDLISVEFGIGSYYSGAAHPNSHTLVLNFDLKNGKPIRLADLFTPGSKYLQAISTYSIQDLRKQSKDKGADSMLDDDWIQRGAGASAENYQSWTIAKNGINVTFDSYQVAPYAAGSQEVLIPYSALKDIIRADGPIAKFLS